MLEKHSASMHQHDPELDESFKQCPNFSGYADIAAMRQDLDDIKQTMQEVRDILEVWNSAKGFVTTMVTIGSVLKWVVVTGGMISAIWLALRHGLKGD